MTAHAPKDQPLSLDAAARLAFPDGRVKASTLRLERDRGRLDTWKVGKCEYTSLAAIERMLDLCRNAPKDRASTSAAPAQVAPQPGSSSTPAGSSAQVAALASAKRLKQRLQNTSRGRGSKPPASVIPLRSPSQT